MLELYYNSGKFTHSLHFILRRLCADPFAFYEELSSYWNTKGLYDSPKSLGDLFDILNVYITAKYGYILQFNELIKLDWLLLGKDGPIPGSIDRRDHTGIKAPAHKLLKDEAFIREIIPDANEEDVKAIQKTGYYELFSVDVLSDASCTGDTLVFFLPVNSVRGRQIIAHAVDPNRL